jgi:N-acetylmuramoyl-L-alanine amidase
VQKQGANFLLFIGLLVVSGCARFGRPGTASPRKGDEIVVAGQLFHTGTPVVLWMDADGYDAYRVERRFSLLDRADWKSSVEDNPSLTTPNRYGQRRSVLSESEAEQTRGGGWPLSLLREKVDQFVIHYDVAGTSRECFKTLHDVRDLSVHFMLDLDGTIYQTLDLKERAWHATTSNSRSIGIEIANVGAYSPQNTNVLDRWYKCGPDGRSFISIPSEFEPSGIRNANGILRPARNQPVKGTIQDQELVQYDFTPQQYEALIKLTATLCTIFPKIDCHFPEDEKGKVVPEKLSDERLSSYQGLLGHFHIQRNKTDPGPAFDWDRVIGGARQLLQPALGSGKMQTYK